MPVSQKRSLSGFVVQFCNLYFPVHCVQPALGGTGGVAVPAARAVAVRPMRSVARVAQSAQRRAVVWRDVGFIGVVVRVDEILGE